MSKVSILIVEDELIIAEDIRMMLTDLGYDVVGTAIDYDEAMVLMEHRQPDVALVDILIAGDKSCYGSQVAGSLFNHHPAGDIQENIRFIEGQF